MRSGVVYKRIVGAEDAVSPSTPSASFDTQFLEQANRRLGLVSGVFAGAVATLVLTTLLLYGPLGWESPEHLPHFLGAQTVLFLLSAGMGVICWRRLFSPQTTVRVGLVYQVTGALIISVCAFHGDMLLQPVMVKLSWLAVWILLFPLFVPGPPVRSLIVSLLSATTAPAVFLFWSFAHSQELPELPVFAVTFVPYYVCAGLAVIPAWLVYDLGTTATAAREAARRLGSYRLVELIGTGGMGEVWRAEHSLLARPAAIKLVTAPTTGKTGTAPLNSREEVLGRFEREAQTTAALTSPHTVRLYDYGVTEDNTFYYAMELLDGLDLETLVDRFGPVSPARAIYLLRQVCESLAEAHRAGLVHRDIKPSNLVACHVGGRVDFIKVLDFGLVRRLQRPKDDVLVSDRNYLVGTPAFMAPELASSPDAVDGRADVYALGCVAYWLVTGRLVFEQPTIAGMIADHVHEEPLPPSTKAERPVPEAFEQLILDCLAKDPQRRPQSADELYRRLGKLQVGRRWTQQQAHLWWHARLKELLPEGVTSSATPTWSSVHLPPLDQLSLPSRPAVPAAAPQPEAAPPPEQAPAPEPTTAAAPPRVAVPEPDPTLLLEDDDEPDFARWPAVPVSAISEIRIRARVRQYARARDESRAAKAAEAATPVEGEP